MQTVVTYTDLGAKDREHSKVCQKPWYECSCSAAMEIRRLLPEAEANFTRMHYERRFERGEQ